MSSADFSVEQLQNKIDVFLAHVPEYQKSKSIVADLQKGFEIWYFADRVMHESQDCERMFGALMHQLENSTDEDLDDLFRILDQVGVFYRIYARETEKESEADRVIAPVILEKIKHQFIQVMREQARINERMLLKGTAERINMYGEPE